MTSVAIIRCEKNMDSCPLTSCFRCLMEKKEGFAIYEDCILAGVFTCRCPGDLAVNLSKILKAKGAEAIHFIVHVLLLKEQVKVGLPKMVGFVKILMKSLSMSIRKQASHVSKVLRTFPKTIR